MKHTLPLTRLFALLLVSLLVLSSCGGIGDLIAPYESELSELGGALLDQLIEPDGTAPDTAPISTSAPDSSAPATSAPATSAPATTATPTTTAAPEKIDRNGSYTSRDDVALYLKTYGELPNNFITKNEAEDLGWVSSKGNLHDVAPGKSIGGDYFGNYEGRLPKASGRKYYECDIDYKGGYRGAKRIVFSNDGLIFYTDDHYDSFTQLNP